MSYRDKTYVIFDGDNDQWAYRFMRGWNANENIDFNFQDAHDILPMTYRAQDESYVKGRLRARFESASQVIVLIGESTKNLYKYVRWELQVALDLNLPIIAVNLNDKKAQDSELCPAIIRDEYVVHIPFRLKIIKYALDNFPNEYRYRDRTQSGPRYYNSWIYQNLGLNG